MLSLPVDTDIKSQCPQCMCAIRDWFGTLAKRTLNVYLLGQKSLKKDVRYGNKVAVNG